MKFVLYNNYDQKVGEVITNHSITKEECCILAGMNTLDKINPDDPDYERNGYFYWYDDLYYKLEG